MASDHIAQEFIQSSFESLQGQRLHSLYGLAVHCLTILMENVSCVGTEKSGVTCAESFYIAWKVAQAPCYLENYLFTLWL